MVGGINTDRLVRPAVVLQVGLTVAVQVGLTRNTGPATGDLKKPLVQRRSMGSGASGLPWSTGVPVWIEKRTGCRVIDSLRRNHLGTLLGYHTQNPMLLRWFRLDRQVHALVGIDASDVLGIAVRILDGNLGFAVDEKAVRAGRNLVRGDLDVGFRLIGGNGCGGDVHIRRELVAGAVQLHRAGMSCTAVDVDVDLQWLALRP